MKFFKSLENLPIDQQIESYRLWFARCLSWLAAVILFVMGIFNGLLASNQSLNLPILWGAALVVVVIDVLCSNKANFRTRKLKT